MIELALIAGILWALQVNIAPFFSSLAVFCAAAIGCAAAFNAGVERLHSDCRLKLFAFPAESSRITVAGVLALVLASFSSAAKLPLLSDISGAEVSVTIGLSAIFGATVALCALAPLLVTNFTSALLAPTARISPVLLRSLSLVALTIFMFFFWGRICDAFILLVSKGR